MANNHVKLDDWRDRLAECVNSRIGTQPEWGTNDCMMWAADCVLAQTGVDDLATYRGKYKSAQGGLRVLMRRHKFKQPIELMDLLWGPRLHISQAMHGDLVVSADLGEPAGMGPSIGLCYGVRSLFVGTDEHADGLVRLDTLSLEHCYRPWASSSRQPSP
jgi:hypothetical protein